MHYKYSNRSSHKQQYSNHVQCIKLNKSSVFVCSLVSLTTISAIALLSSTVSADTARVDTVATSVPASCSFTSASTSSYGATILNGQTTTITADPITATCNDASGYAVYAIGYSGDTYTGDYHTDMISTLSNSYNIKTNGTNGASYWKMKLQDLSNAVIANSYNDYQVIPSNFTKIASYTSNTTAASFTPVYQIYIGTTQPADTYTGKVKYTLVHPNNAIAPDATSLSISYNGNGLYFGGNPSSTVNTVVYNATSTRTQHNARYAHTSNIDDAGVATGTYLVGRIGTRDIITIPGATRLEVNLSYSIEENWDYLYVFTGNYGGTITGSNNAPMNAGQDYTFTGGNSASSGSNQTSFSITGDTATFAFWSDAATAYYGYYAIITGYDANDNVVPYYTTDYSKVAMSGTYAAPGYNTGGTDFKGWSESSNATTPTYTSEAEISTSFPAVNGDASVTLYAVYDHAETKMQNLNPSLCTTGGLKVYDERDNSIYLVRKLADNKCWMVQNLNLSGGTALSADDTDVTSTYINGFTTQGNLTKSGNTIVLPASTIAGFGSTINAVIYNSGNTTNCGGDGQSEPCYSYYSWIAATLGGKQSDGSTAEDGAGYNAAASICPKGWRLPTATTSNAPAGTSPNWKTGDWYALATAYGANLESAAYENNNDNFLTNAGPGTLANFLLAGSYQSTQFVEGGQMGNYWSATSNSSNAISFLIRSGVNYDTPYKYVHVASNSNRGIGSSVRCILRE